MKDNGIIIKTASKDDAGKIALTEKECLAVGWSEKTVSDSIESGKYSFRIAFNMNDTAGSGGIMFLPPEAEITNIAVRKEHRRHGIATMILDSLLDEALSLGCESVFLEVAGKNIPAVKLYEKFGFEPVYIRKNYYKDPPGDAIVMKKVLKK